MAPISTTCEDVGQQQLTRRQLIQSLALTAMATSVMGKTEGAHRAKAARREVARCVTHGSA